MDGSAFQITAADDDEDGAEQPGATWELVPHCCRRCLGRVLARTTDDGHRIARCSDCGLAAIGEPDVVCWCGITLGATRVRLRCERNPTPTEEFPAEIVVVEAAA
jgi:hypothetical protein